jgi:hypothetical protein
VFSGCDIDFQREEDQGHAAAQCDFAVRSQRGDVVDSLQNDEQLPSVK